MEKKNTGFVQALSTPVAARALTWNEIQQVLNKNNVNPAIQHNISDKLKTAYLGRFITDVNKPTPATVTMANNDWKKAIIPQEIINVLNAPMLERHINKKCRNQIIQDLDLQLDGIGFLGL